MAPDIKDLTKEEYERVRHLIYAESGINLGDQKMQLVRARLGKRIRQGGFSSFGAYLDHVANDSSGGELCGLLDAISTNTTHLFREIRHFELLRELVEGWLADRNWRAGHRTLRVWSAGCSSGEEPHSIAMVLHHAVSEHGGPEVKILATDLSTRMLATARAARYDQHRVGTVPPAYRQRYLQRALDGKNQGLELIPDARRLITLARFNLMTPTFPFKHGFHVIFCRNVMIYFDRPTQEALVNRFANHLLPGGYLMIGHSESLNGVKHPLDYVEPTVYKKR